MLEDCDATIPLTGWQWLTSSANYGRQVQQVRDWIGAGDLFQANLTACAEQKLNTHSNPWGSTSACSSAHPLWRVDAGQPQ